MKGKIPSRKFDVIVHGATGFTGRLAAQYLRKNYPEMKVGFSGRSAAKLEALVADIDGCTPDQIVIADASDDASLDTMTASTRVVVSFAGPFAEIGTPVVGSCIRSGTHYCDITGETPWVRKMIDQFDDAAKKAGVSIVHCSGFDSIPSDIGCLHMVNALRARDLEPKEVRMVVGDSKGGVSGGTIASAIGIITNTPLSELAKFANPFVLAERDPITGEGVGAKDPTPSMDCNMPQYDSVFKTYTSPWVMQGVNTRIVNFSNSKMNWAYGRELVYSERAAASGPLAALSVAVALPIFTTLLFLPFTRWFLRRFVLPAQGQGPSEQLRESGFFRMKFWATGTDKNGAEQLITGGIDAFEGDPGYKQTAKMAAETAICLLEDRQRDGVLSPASALGDALQARLEAKKIHFYID